MVIKLTARFMKKIATSPESQIRQQVFPAPASYSISPRAMTVEEQKEWDAALTPEEFKREVCRLLKEKFDEWERSKVR